MTKERFVAEVLDALTFEEWAEIGDERGWFARRDAEALTFADDDEEETDVPDRLKNRANALDECNPPDVVAHKIMQGLASILPDEEDDDDITILYCADCIRDDHVLKTQSMQIYYDCKNPVDGGQCVCACENHGTRETAVPDPLKTKGHITCEGCSFHDGEKCTSTYSMCPSNQWRRNDE